MNRDSYVCLSALLFTIGAAGLLVNRNATALSSEPSFPRPHLRLVTAVGDVGADRMDSVEKTGRT